MDAGSIVALIALVITLPLSIVALVQSKRANAIAANSTDAAGRAAIASERSAHAAEQQTAIQDALARHAAEPSLWVDIRPDDQHGQLLRLLVGNSGPTVARDVVVVFDPPLGDAPRPRDAAHVGEERLGAGLASLPPGRVLAWSMGFAGTFFTENASTPLAYEVTINARGPFGALEPLTYTIDLHDIAQNHAVPPGTLHGITKALEAIEKDLKSLTQRP